MIPAYNREREISRALDSCLRQSFRDFEVIVVDDGSFDGTADVADRTGDPRTTLLRHDRNLGVCAARNTGVRRRPAKWGHDAAVLGHRLLHDDNGSAWRSWFTAAGLEGFERAKHLYFTDYSLTITAALRGQGIALGAAAFIETELKTGRLAQVGHSPR